MATGKKAKVTTNDTSFFGSIPDEVQDIILRRAYGDPADHCPANLCFLAHAGQISSDGAEYKKRCGPLVNDGNV